MSASVLPQSFTQILRATDQCLEQAGVARNRQPIVACLALAGIGDLTGDGEVISHPHPFAGLVCTSDAQAACVGAHAGRDGGIVIVGTGSIGWANLAGQSHRVGGWGFPVSDEGSGAWLGSEAVRRVLWASDGLTPWTDLLRAIFEQFGSDPHAIVRWTSTARPRDYAQPRAARRRACGERATGWPRTSCRAAALHIDALATRLIELGATRLSLMGGLADAHGAAALGAYQGCARRADWRRAERRTAACRAGSRAPGDDGGELTCTNRPAWQRK